MALCHFPLIACAVDVEELQLEDEAETDDEKEIKDLEGELVCDASGPPACVCPPSGRAT